MSTPVKPKGTQCNDISTILTALKYNGDKPPSNCCEWAALSCNADGAVVRLWLSDTQLTGTIPGALGNLTSLQELWLFNNRLTGTIPDLQKLANIQVMRLYNNLLSGPIPASLGALTTLDSLDLSGNQLTGAIPDALGKLPSLTSLFLQNNTLTGPIPDLRTKDGCHLLPQNGGSSSTPLCFSGNNRSGKCYDGIKDTVKDCGALPAPAQASDQTADTSSGSFPTLIVGICAAVVVVLTVMGFMVRRRSRNVKSITVPTA
ncbi:hypothetical protein BC828DRAFT_379801 [Blastocladiella britannica]|nr:hypothetical protein BC828DRAFT_379801 [Blastocladiella britannica]